MHQPNDTIAQAGHFGRHVQYDPKGSVGADVCQGVSPSDETSDASTLRASQHMPKMPMYHKTRCAIDPSDPRTEFMLETNCPAAQPPAKISLRLRQSGQWARQSCHGGAIRCARRSKSGDRAPHAELIAYTAGSSERITGDMDRDLQRPLSCESACVTTRQTTLLCEVQRLTADQQNGYREILTVRCRIG